MEADHENSAGPSVLLNALGEYLGRSGEGLRYVAKRLGIKTYFVRNETGGKALAVTAEDAKRIVANDIKKAEIISPADLMKG
jgi:hypothetical protein